MNWFDLVKTIAPIVLGFSEKTRPFAPYIGEAIEAAETLGKSGPEKLQAAKDLTKVLVQVTNDQMGREVINPALSDAALEHSISAVVDIANLIERSHVLAPTP
jgi:hypothetical protein